METQEQARTRRAADAAEAALCTHLKFLVQVYKKMRLALVGERAEICCSRCGVSAEITQ